MRNHMDQADEALWVQDSKQEDLRDKNKLKYIHGALTIVLSRAQGNELEIVRSAIKMVE